MSSPERKKKTVKTTKKPSLKKKKAPNPSLPDDLLLSIFARVSKLYYPTLSLVSKSFRSLLTSPELYQTRSSLGHIEICLYVCLEFPHETNPRWFTLCRKPDPTNSNKTESSGYVLAAIPIPQSPPTHWSGHVALGSNIYNIGGYIENKPSSSVSVLDCRTHTWREAPSLQVQRRSPSACVVNGKIYVAGGFEDDEDSDSLETIEVFDSKTQSWDQMPIPYQKKDSGWLTRSACVQGKFHMMVGGNVLAYDPEEVLWNLVEREMGESWIWISDCAIENVLYCYYRGVFKWYDTKVGLWKVEWCEAVLTVPKSTEFEYAIAATV